MHMAMIRLENARGTILRIIMYAFWMFITSVVSLVTRLGVENRSMFENEKVWMLSYWSWRRFLARPAEAREPNTDPMHPTNRPTSATHTMMSAVRAITPISPFSTPWSISTAISSGMIISHTTSAIIHIGVSSESRRYPPTWRSNSFTVFT